MSTLVIVGLMLLALVTLLLFSAVWVLYSSRSLPYQIAQDCQSKVAELQKAFDAASEIIKSTVDAPQQKEAQQILDGIATDFLRQAEAYLAEPKPNYQAVMYARTGMRNVEAAIRYLGHDRNGNFIGIPGANEAIQQLLWDSMHLDPFRTT